MEGHIQRTVDEIVARYELEPQLRDMYVEGPSDKSFFEWFLSQTACKDVTVFCIDTVCVPDTFAVKYRLQTGNRDKLIGVSLHLEQNLSHPLQSLLCIADSDFDFLLGRKHNGKYLEYTDYTSLDMYFLTKPILEKIFKLGIIKAPKSIDSLIRNFTRVLQQIFIIRAANKSLNWRMEWLPFVRYCNLQNEQIVFRSNSFITAFLSKNSRSRDHDKFTTECDKLREIKVQFSRQRIRGHDFMDLLGWYISKSVRRGGNKFRDPAVVRAVLLPAAEIKDIRKERLFRRVVALFG